MNGVNTFNGTTVLNGPIQGMSLYDYITPGQKRDLLMPDLMNKYALYIKGYTSVKQLLDENPFIESRIFNSTERIIWDMTDLTLNQQSEFFSFLYRTRAESVSNLVVYGVQGRIGVSAKRLEITHTITNLSNTYLLTNQRLGGNYYSYVTTLIFHGPNVTNVGWGFLKYGPNSTPIENLYLDLPKTTNLLQLYNNPEYVEPRDPDGKKLKNCIIYAPNVTNINSMFGVNMPNLTSLRLTLKTDNNGKSLVTSASNAFIGCIALPSNQFPTDWSSLSNGSGMFNGCKLLDATTANTILDSLPDWSGDSITHTITFTGTAAATTWSADGADLSHVQAAEAKGWIVER